MIEKIVTKIESLLAFSSEESNDNRREMRLKRKMILKTINREKQQINPVIEQQINQPKIVVLIPFSSEERIEKRQI